MNQIIPGYNGLPDVKDQYDNDEKLLIVRAANKYGVKTVAGAYGLKWQRISSWKRMNKSPKLIIQSPMGGAITPEEIIARIGIVVDKIYVRVDENKAYWVNGDKTGSVNLW